MRVLVGVKRVVDYTVKIRVRPDRAGVELKNVKMAMNPFCEIATEQAVQMKEKKIATETIAFTIGDTKAAETLKVSLAMGIDKGVHVKTDQDLQPLGLAKIMKELVAKYEPDLVVLGKQSIDGDNNMTPQMLSSMLGWPLATFASEVNLDGTALSVTREVDGGLQVIEMATPAVISTDLRLNQPRYATLPNIMKARKKPVDVIPVADLGLDLSSKLKIIEVNEPAERQAGIRVGDVDELVDKLANEAKLI